MMNKKLYTAADIDKATGTISDLRFHDHGHKYTQEEFNEMVSLTKQVLDMFDDDGEGSNDDED